MASSTVIKTISPSTNQVICETPTTTLEQAKEIAKASEDAFASFSALSLADRRAIVVRVLKLCQERKEALGRELTVQMGRPISFSSKEIETMQRRAEYLLEIAEEALADLPCKPEQGFQRWVKRVPVGPTLVVFAWNVCSLVHCAEVMMNANLFPLINSTVSLPAHRQRSCPCAVGRQLCDSQTISSDATRRYAHRRDLHRSRSASQCFAGGSVRRP